MPLKEPIFNLLEQIQAVLQELSDQEYTESVPALSNASIGQHTRHIIEFFSALDNGYESGVINYDKRKRDHSIETHRQIAVQQLQQICEALHKPNKSLSLVTEFESGPVTVDTTYYRELMYNIEHTVHHMAFLRVAIMAVAQIKVPQNFGVAMSTLKFRQSCAQ